MSNLPRRTAAELSDDCRSRLEKRGDIRRDVDAYLEGRFGVHGYPDAADRWLPVRPNERLLYFHRQVPTASLECLAFDLLAGWLATSGFGPGDLKHELVAYTADIYHGGNDAKRRLVELELIEGRPPAVRHAKIGPDSPAKKRPRLLDVRVVPDAAGLGPGGPASLVAFHAWIRARAGLPPCRLDIGDLIEGPKNQARAVLAESAPVLDEVGLTYQFYLSLFLTGERVLVVADLDGDDQAVRDVFRDTSADLEGATGVPPQIVEIPHRVGPAGNEEIHLEAIPTWVLEASDWRRVIVMPDAGATIYGAAGGLIAQLLSPGG